MREIRCYGSSDLCEGLCGGCSGGLCESCYEGYYDESVLHSISNHVGKLNVCYIIFTKNKRNKPKTFYIRKLKHKYKHIKYTKIPEIQKYKEWIMGIIYSTK